MKHLRLGQLAYRFVFAPWAKWRRADGPMRRAAARFRPAALPLAPATWPKGLFLTGSEFWHQTIFCAGSFEWAAGRSLRWEFHDDGTLDRQGRLALTRAFPTATIVDAAEIRRRLDAALPTSRFPALRAIREKEPMMRKLTDLRSGRSGPSLYLDSDMLFFSAPTELLAWMDRPEGSWFLHDELHSYAAPAERLEALFGHPVLQKVNAGLLALDATPIDWEWCERVAQKAGDLSAHVLFEQTLTAFHLTRVGARRLPPDRYRLLYEPFRDPPSATLLHYCWNSKTDYRTREWRRFLQLIRRGPRESNP